jgi:hypothetical protein
VFRIHAGNIGEIGYKTRTQRVSPWARAIIIVIMVLLAAAGLVAAGAGWLYVSGQDVKGHLTTAKTQMAQLRVEMERGDAVAARSTLADLASEARAARAGTGDPMWRLAAGLPRLGDSVTATNIITGVLDDLTKTGLPELVEIGTAFNSAKLAPHNGRVLLAKLPGLAPQLVRADAALRQAQAQIAAIAVEGVLPQLRSAVLELRSWLGRATEATGTALRALRLLPSMLGFLGPRTYLVLFQNNAEVRATGGMPGAFAVMRTDKGAVRIVDMGTAVQLRTFDRPVLPLAQEMRGLYENLPGLFPADVNLTPHFPTAAKLAREMYRRRTGRVVDGVVATDPVALSYLLRATGPVAVAGGPTLTATNAVRVLLSGVYARVASHAEQDRYFLSSARAVFDAITTRHPSPRAALAAIARAAGERRLLVWSAHPNEERELTGTVLAGALPDDDGDRPNVGVYLNDGTGAKLSYYLTHTAQLTEVGCPIEGHRKLRLRVVLGSTAPRRGLSESVLGLGMAGEPYTVRTLVMVFSPTGGDIVYAARDGRPASWISGTERKRDVARFTVDLKPGARQTLDVTLVTDIVPHAAPWRAPQLQVTPGLTSWNASIKTVQPC